MTALDDLIRTLLYEGYALYPYRSSALKNKTAIPFGILYPESYCRLNPYKNNKMQTQCLLPGDMETKVKISYQFLHLSQAGMAVQHAPFALEREVTSDWLRLEDIRRKKINIPFCFSDTSNANEPHTLYINGFISVSAERIENKSGAFRLTTTIQNKTALNDENRQSIEKVSFVATHAILSTTGRFISLQDPGPDWEDESALLKNLNCFPVIFDDNASILLSSPVALYDRPQIHGQSSGDLFDGTELEEALILHLQVLTDDEKKELKRDDKLNIMLNRMETVSPEHLFTIHDFLKENNFSGI